MPSRALKYCKSPGCSKITSNPNGYCDEHVHIPSQQIKEQRARIDAQRPSRSVRGYNREWYRIRAEVLRNAGIPKEEWSQWAVDHRPRYNPEVEPDHRKYILVPMKIKDHNKKTVMEDGGFGNKRKMEN